MPQYSLSDNAAAAVVVESPSITKTMLGTQHRLDTNAEDKIHFHMLLESSTDVLLVFSSIKTPSNLRCVHRDLNPGHEVGNLR